MQVTKNYIVVRDIESLSELIKHIRTYDILAYDTETTGLNVRKDSIIGFSLCGREGTSFYFPTKFYNVETNNVEDLYINEEKAEILAIRTLNLVIELGKKIVCHNASFDIQITNNYFNVNLLPYLHADTGLMLHTVQEEGVPLQYGNPFALKSMAKCFKEQIGLDIEEDANKEQIELKESVKKNGGLVKKAEFEIYKADLDILCRYGAADTDLTLRLYKYLYHRIEEEDLLDFFFEVEVMPLYKEVTIPMEVHGIALDLNLIEKTDSNIIKDLEEAKNTVLAAIMEYPEAKEYVVESATEKYPCKAKGKWALKLLENNGLLSLLPLTKSNKPSLSKKTISILPDGPIKSFLETGDESYLETVEKIRISVELWKEDHNGEFINIQSSDQLGKIFFDKMGLLPLATTDKGKAQFDMTYIEHLAEEGYDWAKKLRTYNKLLKIKSTYIDRFKNKAEDGIFYPYFKQNGTVSGRYGSDLQQLPKPKEEGDDDPIIVKYNNTVRAFFIAGKGRKFIDDDYSSLEPRIFSSITGDEGLRDIYRNGWDFYSTIAIKAEKLDEQTDLYPDGVSPDTKSPVFLKKLNPTKRNRAKAYSLGLAYGMSSFALAKTLNVTQEEGKIIHDGYLNGFPKLKEWIQNSRQFMKENGYIKNKVGRIRHLPDAKKLYDRFGDALLNWKEKERLEQTYGDVVKQWYAIYKNALNNCLNFQIQSMGASIVNRAALAINRKAKEMNIDALVVAQIHDQLVINVAEEQAELFAPIVQDIMENHTKLEGVKLIAEPEIANNLFEGH